MRINGTGKVGVQSTSLYTTSLNTTSLTNRSNELSVWDYYLESSQHKDLKTRLHKAIDSMSGRKKEIFKLYLLNKTQDEIAIILNISRSTVKTYIDRGIKELKALLA